MNKFKIGFVGSGYMAREHARVFAIQPQAELTAVYGRTRSSAEKFAAEYNLKISDSVTDLYKLHSCDLLIVAVDELSIYSVMNEAVNYPWAILLEKPPGYNLAESERLHDKINNSQSRCFVALNRRYMSSVGIALTELSDSESRRLVTINDQEDIVQARLAGQPEEVLKYWMYANSIHIIDLMHVFCRGEVLEVKNVFKWSYSMSPSLVLASVNFDSGDQAVYKAVWNAASPWAVEIVNNKKRLELRPIESAFLQKYGERKSEQLISSQDDKNFKPGLLAMARDTISMLSAENHRLTSFAEALRTMRLIHKIYQV